MDWRLILGAALLGVLVVIAQQYRAARGTYRPLSRRQPQRRVANTPELGMEAIDMTEVRRTQRSNESLERVNDPWSQRRGGSRTVDTSVDAMPDDETYAKRFHAAFMKNKD